MSALQVFPNLYLAHQLSVLVKDSCAPRSVRQVGVGGGSEMDSSTHLRHAAGGERRPASQWQMPCD